MTYNPDLHHRHSIRLKEYDYARAGAYFVTICAWQRECLLGAIVDGAMVLNDAGRIVADEWERTADIRSNVELDVYAIMPNHFHAIIVIHDVISGPTYNNRATHRVAPTVDIYDDVGAMPVARPGATGADVVSIQRVSPVVPVSGSIGAIMAQFKSIVTKRINQHRATPGCPVWQRNYYERVIRNDHELSRAREYIINNPTKWVLDRENPVNHP